MAELVDALVSEASEETHGSSSLLGHTNLICNKKEYIMKGLKKLIVLPILATITLTSCDLFNKILNLLYKDVYEFYKKEGYAETKSLDDFNKLLQDKMYTWSEKNITYQNTGNTDTFYYSPHGDYISFDERYTQITVNSRFGERYAFFYGEDRATKLSYTFEENDKLVIHEGTMYYLDSQGYRQEMDQDHLQVLRMQEDDNGYLFLSGTGFMCYAKKDFTKIYPYIQCHNRFEFENETINVPESALLTEGLSKYTDEPKLALPLPKDYQDAIHHKDYFNSDNEWYAYDVIIPNIKPLEYIPLLKENGFEVYRGEYREMFELDGENGGEWIVYDSTLSVAIHLQYANPICVAKDGKDNFGVQLHVMHMETRTASYGRTVNTQTDWQDDEKTFMQETFGTVLPFINLGRKYGFDKKKRANGEHPMVSALDMDTECYWCFDNFYKDVITDKYGELLESAGFRAYICPVTKQSDRDAIKEWEYSDDVKYYECYLNDELEIAVKFGFDDIYGNYIKVFKYADLIPWHDSLKDK